MNGSRPDPSIDGARKAEEEARLRERHIVPLPGQTTGGSGDPRAIIHAAPSEPTGQLRPEAFQGGPKGTGQP